MLLVVAVCLALGYWQLRRGEAGNLRSYAYAIEWPFFAGAAAYMWWRTMRDDTTSDRAGALSDGADTSQFSAATQPPGYLKPEHYAEPEPDPELDAYNAYLADLHRAATGQR